MLYTKHARPASGVANISIFEVPVGHHVVIKHIFIANHASVSNTVSLKLQLNTTPSSTATWQDELDILNGKSVASNDYFSLRYANLFVFHENERLLGIPGAPGGSTTGDIEFAITLNLIPNPNVLPTFDGS